MAMNQSEHYQLIDQVISLENDFSSPTCGLSNIIPTQFANQDPTGLSMLLSDPNGPLISNPLAQRDGVELIDDGSGSLTQMTPMSQVQALGQQQARLSCVMQDCVDSYACGPQLVDSGPTQDFNSLLSYDKQPGPTNGDLIAAGPAMQALEQDEEKVGIETIRKELVECDQTQQMLGQYNQNSSTSISRMAATGPPHQNQYTCLVQPDQLAGDMRHLTTTNAHHHHHQHQHQHQHHHQQPQQHHQQQIQHHHQHQHQPNHHHTSPFHPSQPKYHLQQQQQQAQQLHISPIISAQQHHAHPHAHSHSHPHSHHHQHQHHQHQHQQQHYGPPGAGIRQLQQQQQQQAAPAAYSNGHVTYVPVSSPAVSSASSLSAYVPQNVTWLTQRQQAANAQISMIDPGASNGWQSVGSSPSGPASVGAAALSAPQPAAPATIQTGYGAPSQRTQLSGHHHHHQQALARQTNHYMQQPQLVTNSSIHHQMQQQRLAAGNSLSQQASTRTTFVQAGQAMQPRAASQTIVVKSTVSTNAPTLQMPTMTTAVASTKAGTTATSAAKLNQAIYIDENGTILDPQAMALSQNTRRQFSSIDNNNQSAEYFDMRSSGSLSQDWLDKICRQLVEHMNHFGICVIDNFLGSIKADMILKEVHQLYGNGQHTKGRLVSNKFDQQQQQQQTTTTTTTTAQHSTTTTTTRTTTSASPPPASGQAAAASPRDSNSTSPKQQQQPQQQRSDGTGAIRSDRVIWVDGCEEGCEEINNLIQTLCSVITNSSRLSLYCNNGLDKIVINKRTKAHVACYPGNGTRYIKHVDNPNGDGRVITAIYYLNKNWNTKRDGGLLRMFPAGMDEVANIEPLFDRVLFFWSDRRNPHEVLPAYRDRFAITVWYMGENRHIEHP